MPTKPTTPPPIRAGPRHADQSFQRGRAIIEQPTLAPPEPPAKRSPPITTLEREILKYLADEKTDKDMLLRALRACETGGYLLRFLTAHEAYMAGRSTPEAEFVMSVLTLHELGVLTPSRILQELPEFADDLDAARRDARLYLKVHPQFVAEFAAEVSDGK